MLSIAFCIATPSADAMLTVPSSSTSILTPVSSMMPRMILPPGPMTSRIWSGLILSVEMRGAYGDSSARGCASALCHLAEDVQAPLARLLERLRA